MVANRPLARTSRIAVNLATKRVILPVFAMRFRLLCVLPRRWARRFPTQDHVLGTTMLIAYEPVWGIGFLFMCCGCGIGLLVWVVFWLIHRFRASVPVTLFGRIALWCVVGLVAVVAGLFPPVRKAGDWWDESNGQPVSPTVAGQLDRFYFGWMPKFAWLGQVGVEEPMTPGVRVGLGVSGVSAHCDHARWAVDCLALAIEACGLILLVLPFARARRSTVAARTLAEKRLP